MLIENLGSERYCLFCGNGSVGQHLKSKLVIIRHITHTGILYLVTHIVNRGINRIGVDHADRRSVLLLVLLLGNISSAMIEGQFHAEAGIVRQGCNVAFGIQDLDVRIGFDASCGHFSWSGHLNETGLSALAVKLGNNALHIEHDFRNILLHTGNGGNLVQNTVDLDAHYRNTGQRTQQHPAQ